jgi:adenylate cyclase
METIAAYVPADERAALSAGVALPAHTSGAALFADISGFTPLTEALARALGARRGAEELTRQLNQVYDALIAEVDRFGGSIIGFSGDAIMCWFDDNAERGTRNAEPKAEGPTLNDEQPAFEPTMPSTYATDAEDPIFSVQRSAFSVSHPAPRAMACALALQQTMQQFAALPLPPEARSGVALPASPATTTQSSERNTQSSTGGGSTALALKVALASGPARRFLVGDPAIQQLPALAGATVARTATAEHLAQRGEILADEATIALLGERVAVAEWRTDEASGERFGLVTALAGPVAAQPWPRFPAGGQFEDALRPWVLPDVYARLREGLGEFLTELRLAVALFLRFDGIDYDDDPDAPARLDAFIRRVQLVLVRYGGTMIQLTIGDKGSYLYVAFGAPVAHEDDPQRAVAAALELRALPAELPFIKPVQIGVTRGLMRTGAYGGVTRRTYGVLGDEVNLAARLMQTAAPGEIVASGRVQASVEAQFELEVLRPITVKGKSDPIPIARVLGARALPAGAGRYGGALVGRAADLAALSQRIAPIFAGRFAGLLSVHGEAGMGKSRLVHELRRALEARRRAHKRRLPGWFVLPAEGVLRQSLHPVRVFLRAYFGQENGANWERLDAALDELLGTLQRLTHRADDAAGLAAELARTRSFLAALVDLRQHGSLYEQLDPRLRFENTLRAVSALLRAESLRRPLVVQVEDAHWLDDDTRALLETLARDAHGFPLALLLTSRYGDDGTPLALAVAHDVPRWSLDLGALNEAGVRELAGQTLGAPVDDALLAFLVRRTAGNPFFVEQVVLDLRERGMLATRAVDDGAATIAFAEQPRVQELPDSIAAVLVARIDRLAAHVKAIVQTAAVLGQEFEVRVLSQMLRDDPWLPARVRQAEQEAIWSSLNEIRYLFRHALLRDAAYGMQLRARLRELHRLAGESIEQLANAEQDSVAFAVAERAADLAYHFRRADDVPRERRYVRLAGETAAARYANADAVAFFGRALELVPVDDRDERHALLLAREEIYDRRGARDEQAADLRALAELADQAADDGRRAIVALREANYAEVTGDYPAAIGAAERVVELGRAIGAVASEAAGFFRWGRALFLLADYPAATERLSQALALAGDELPEVAADSLRNLGLVALHTGAYATARQYAGRALAVFETAGRKQGSALALNNLGTAAYYEGDYGEAHEFITRALAVAQEIGDRLSEGDALISLAAVARQQNDMAAARVHGEQALRVCRAIGDTWGESSALNGLSNLAFFEGDLPRAREYQEQGLGLCRRTGDRLGESIALIYLGDIAAACGEAGARDRYDEALAIVRAVGHREFESWCLATLGMFLEQQGDRDGALAAGQRAFELALEVGGRSEEARARTTIGHALVGLGRPQEADEQFRQSLALRRAIGEHGLALDTLAGVVRAALASGDTPGAYRAANELLVSGGASAFGGAADPLRSFLVCWQALERASDERAPALLAEAHALLVARAERLEAPLRDSFLEQVPTNRTLADAWRSATHQD